MTGAIATTTVSTDGNGAGTPPAATAAPAAATTPPTLLGAAPTEAPKAAEGAPAAEAPKTAAPTGAPEKYSDFTMPEGITVDKAALEGFTPVLKGLNLTQESAQQLVTAYATEQQRQATEFGKQLQNPEFAVQQAGLMLNAQRDAWAAAVKADKDIGGANFQANIESAQRALARFGGDELKSLLNSTGLGNHPALVKMFVAVGKQIREDNPEYGASTTGRKSTAEVFYPALSGSGA